MMRGHYKITLLCIVALLAFGSLAGATPVNAGFNAGNPCYAAGRYAEAIAFYEGQVHRSEYTANLFYNLGDAYFRQGNRGRAILNYQRALILDPMHAEAAANLAFARGGKPTVPARNGWISTLLPWCTAAAGWLAAAGLLMVLAGHRWRAVGYGSLATGLLACTAGVAAIWFADGSTANTARAVIVVDSAPALYAPAENSKVVTNLTAGGEVRVLSDQGAWVYVLLGDGTRAWLASDKIESVVPR